MSTKVSAKHALSSCALMIDGRVSCWGANYYGQLGDNSFGAAAGKVTPVPVSGLGKVIAIAPGEFHMCALEEAGTVSCWGLNTNGQIGDGTFGDGNNRAVPTRIPGLSGVVAITAGNKHTCALKADGTAFCWGANSAGQLGDNSKVDKSSPSPVFGGALFWRAR
jgi:alpha-tubulin suppressor-like RCC1 family protein